MPKKNCPRFMAMRGNRLRLRPMLIIAPIETWCLSKCTVHRGNAPCRAIRRPKRLASNCFMNTCEDCGSDDVSIHSAKGKSWIHCWQCDHDGDYLPTYAESILVNPQSLTSSPINSTNKSHNQIK